MDLNRLFRRAAPTQGTVRDITLVFAGIVAWVLIMFGDWAVASLVASIGVCVCGLLVLWSAQGENH